MTACCRRLTAYDPSRLPLPSPVWYIPHPRWQRRVGSFSTWDEGRDENAPAGFRPPAPRETGIEEQARSSGGEHYLDTVGVSGSNPLEPTNFFEHRRLAQLGERILHTDEVNGSIPLAPTRSLFLRGVTRVFSFRVKQNGSPGANGDD